MLKSVVAVKVECSIGYAFQQTAGSNCSLIFGGEAKQCFMKGFGLCAVLLLTGCLHRVNAPPALSARPCPAGSVELTNVTHCFDPPTCKHTESMNRQLCMALNPANGKPIGLFAKVGSCNPYLSPDCDDPDVAREKKSKPWWKLWARKGGHD